MRTATFFILGYGVPRNIFKDENYQLYLKMVFNKIYDLVVKKRLQKPIIVFCGGETDCFPPYRRTESFEMVKFFRSLTDRPLVLPFTKHWRIIRETKSINTLESLIYGKRILERERIRQADVYVFCEQTRARRTSIIAKKVFIRFHPKIVPIDFDISQNRYLELKFIQDKEKRLLSLELWAFQSHRNFQKLHRLFKNRLVFLRKAGPQRHKRAVKKWWEKELSYFQNKILK